MKITILGLDQLSKNKKTIINFLKKISEKKFMEELNLFNKLNIDELTNFYIVIDEAIQMNLQKKLGYYTNGCICNEAEDIICLLEYDYDKKNHFMRDRCIICGGIVFERKVENYK